jgi:hypothetical protein
MMTQAPGDLGNDDAVRGGGSRVESSGRVDRTEREERAQQRAAEQDTPTAIRRNGHAAQGAGEPPDATKGRGVAPLCWPFPIGSQNNTDMAVKLKPYVPPKRRTLNQY